MSWDDLLLLILAFFGAVSLLLAQISDVLSRLPQIIRAWRQVRQEWSGGRDTGSSASGARTSGRLRQGDAGIDPNSCGRHQP
ncbi:hypothetical protein [Streptomyces sp. SudanB52_2052]|uniref:hypothetical protein n=1 Tax=Streptomyces sp. SudanB52_2052 TaxID=3035276 RepID=UPI003F57E7A6